MQACEIEIDGSLNEALHFRPLMRSIRGQFDLMRMGEPMAKLAAQHWPPIPSQRIGFDPDGNGYILEPLHDAQHVGLKEKIERAGMRLEPALQTFAAIDLASWVFWLKDAVASGLARVVKGKLPDDVPGKPRMDFILAEPEATSTDKLTTALTEQTQAFNRLADVLTKFMESK